VKKEGARTLCIVNCIFINDGHELKAMGYTSITTERDTSSLLSHCVRAGLSAGQYILL